MKGRAINKGNTRTAVKTERFLTETDNILALNRRLTSPIQIRAELKREFEDAQMHLNDCNVDPSKWQNAEAKNCKRLYVSESVVNAGIAHMQGIRPAMEDTHIATTFLVSCHKRHHHVHLYGIFDGHGGECCAKYLAQHLPIFLKTALESILENCFSSKAEEAAIFNILKLAFVELGAEYRKSGFLSGGSTANIALILKKTLWVANVGDTRSILVLNGHPVALSEDAKPAMEKYKRGVEKRQCVVMDVDGVPRVGGVMAVARAVGHHEIASGISPRAKVTKYSLRNLPIGRNYLVIACDGLWDVASSNQVAQTIGELSNLNPEEIAVHLIKKGFEAESTDNISAIVVPISAKLRQH